MRAKVRGILGVHRRTHSTCCKDRGEQPRTQTPQALFHQQGREGGPWPGLFADSSPAEGRKEGRESCLHTTPKSRAKPTKHRPKTAKGKTPSPSSSSSSSSSTTPADTNKSKGTREDGMPAGHPLQKLARCPGHKESDDAFWAIMDWQGEDEHKAVQSMEGLCCHGFSNGVAVRLARFLVVGALPWRVPLKCSGTSATRLGARNHTAGRTNSTTARRAARQQASWRTRATMMRTAITQRTCAK